MGATKRVTINDVAAAAGVSRAAVSKVYNDRPGIPPATASRIRAAAAKLGWAPSSSAAALASSSTRTVGMVISRNPDLLAVDPHFAVLISGIEDVLARHEFGLQLYLIGESAKAEAETYQRIAQQRRVDGVLLTESRIDDSRYSLLEKLKLPYVLIGRPEDRSQVTAAYSPADYPGERAAGSYLLELGHRRIAYVAGPEDRVHTIYRRAAFKDELARAGVALSHEISTVFSSDAAEREAVALLGAAEAPTAIVFANDNMATAAIGALQRAGFEVPRDVSIVGHDDLPFGKWMNPRLTTVGQDLHELGSAGALTLLRALNKTDEAIPVVPPSRLIIRESASSRVDGVSQHNFTLSVPA